MCGSGIRQWVDFECVYYRTVCGNNNYGNFSRSDSIFSSTLFTLCSSGIPFFCMMVVAFFIIIYDRMHTLATLGRRDLLQCGFYNKLTHVAFPCRLVYMVDWPIRYHANSVSVSFLHAEIRLIWCNFLKVMDFVWKELKMCVVSPYVHFIWSHFCAYVRPIYERKMFGVW